MEWWGWYTAVGDDGKKKKKSSSLPLLSGDATTIYQPSHINKNSIFLIAQYSISLIYQVQLKFHRQSIHIYSPTLTSPFDLEKTKEQKKQKSTTMSFFADILRMFLSLALCICVVGLFWYIAITKVFPRNKLYQEVVQGVNGMNKNNNNNNQPSDDQKKK